MPQDLTNIERYSQSLTEQERKEQARRAGEASGKARRERRHFQEVARDILAAATTDSDAAAELERLGLVPSNMGAVVLAMLRQSLAGNVDASRWVRDTAGDKPTETLQAQINRPPVAARDLSEATEEELLSMVDSTKNG